MGFCDVAPGEAQHLRLAFLASGRAHTATLTDAQVRKCVAILFCLRAGLACCVAPLQKLGT
jgi:hypothetical protein